MTDNGGDRRIQTGNGKGRLIVETTESMEEYFQVILTSHLHSDRMVAGGKPIRVKTGYIPQEEMPKSVYLLCFSLYNFCFVQI